MRLRLVKESLNNPDYIFELKHDGFRALAYIDAGECRLVSRNLKSLRLESLASIGTGDVHHRAVINVRANPAAETLRMHPICLLLPSTPVVWGHTPISRPERKPLVRDTYQLPLRCVDRSRELRTFVRGPGMRN
jgi:hypothetical protein